MAAQRNTTKIAKSGRFASKSYTGGSVLLNRYAAPVAVVSRMRSDMFARLAKGSAPAEVLEAVAGYARFVEDARIGKTIDATQEAAILDGLRGLYREIKGIGQGVMLAYGEAVHASPAGRTWESVPNGTYTVVMNGEHRTIRLRKDFRSDSVEGTQVAAFLSGSDNTADYTGFAFVTGGEIKVWGKYRDSAAVAKTREYLSFLMSGRDNWEKAGNAYAKESGRCFMCNRPLTNPDSLAVMIGPECRRKIAA